MLRIFKRRFGSDLSGLFKSLSPILLEHCIACRAIGGYFGRQLGTPAVTNIWIPDGYKDTPVDRLTPRLRLQEALDAVFAEEIDPRFNLDAVEPKLFGIGSESYVTGSMEFYTGYAISRGVLLTLDSGHFHPTETIADKISSLLIYLDRLLLHSAPLARGWNAMMGAMRGRTVLDGSLRELVILRVAVLNRAPYEFAQHAPVALAEGLTQAQLDALDGWQASSKFKHESMLHLFEFLF